MCSLALAACNDDDSIIDRTGGNNLQVEVSANFHSRAPIHESTLPDNNPIGVTLTAKDGSSYDNQNYNNIPYSATTADGKQTWMPQDKPVTLSVTEGVAMAYWPYNADAADMTAVPVETDTQTDYMYSGNVTGLTNATPKAAFQMKHAMTLIRVNVVRGTYTAEGAVTAVTAASEAFCTSGTMNVSTGALAGLAGAGTPFLEEPADAAITTAGRVTEFLVLPDVTVDAASVTLGVTVDGRKYSTAIEVSEAYKQGYIYTYNLTLDNTALNVSAVAVTPWEEEISVEAPEPVAEDDQYIVQVTIDSDNYTYTHNIQNFIGTIDWGDGTVQNIDTRSANIQHTYITADKYLVVCSGKATQLQSWTFNTRDISKLIHIGADMGIISMDQAFQNHKKLAEIHEGALDGCTEVISWNLAFEGTSIQTIPDGLFDKCTKGQTFNRLFASCGKLIYAPSDLFKNCTEATDIGRVFEGCNLKSIDLDVFFKGLTKVKSTASIFYRNSNMVATLSDKTFNDMPVLENVYSMFRSCSKLTGNIPEELFKNNVQLKNCERFIEGCSGLTGEIPEKLFHYNLELTSLQASFKGCSGLTGEIPTNLLKYNTKLTTVGGAMFLGNGCFSDCTGLTGPIPAGLFDNNPEITNFWGVFANCPGLTSIPAGLFDKNLKAKDMRSMFEGCKGITEIPVGLFDNNTEVTIFENTFANTGITSIPEGLFDNCTKVTSFNWTFSGAPITEIPGGLFDNCTEVTSFVRTFNGCINLIEIPTGLFDKNIKTTTFNATFIGCKKLTSIPAGLFDNCTEVTNFSGIFRDCNSLTGNIPTGLFDNNKKVTTFGEAFYRCSGLTGESPYTIINVDGNDIKVHLYERYLYTDIFAVPDGKTCFSYCSNFADWAEITAAGWR